MSPRASLLLGLCILGAASGCGGDAMVGRRFQAERSMWQLSREVRELRIRPDLVTADQWRGLAGRFEAVAREPVPPTEFPANRELRAIQADALLNAAQVYITVGDSARMRDTYTRVEREFSDLPRAIAEVGLARGRMAELRSDWVDAIASYQRVVNLVEPNVQDRGISGSTIVLPLRIARMQVVVAGDTSLAYRRGAYAPAREYYRRIVERPDSATALEARLHLAELAADLEEWPIAEAELRLVESRLRALATSTRDPASARFSLARIQEQMDPTGEIPRATYRSLVTDYPKSRLAPHALLAVAVNLARVGRAEEALAVTQEVVDRFPDSEEAGSQALLTRGRILEGEDRWMEAQLVFSSIPVDYPISEPALVSHIEPIKHYERMGDPAGVEAALKRAEAAYRDFTTRYPTGPASISALEKLARTLAAEERYELAVDEFYRLGVALRGTPQGVTYLLTAARLALTEVGDTTRAVQILETTGSAYADRDVGRWASREAARLRERPAE